MFIGGSGLNPSCEAGRRVGSGAIMVDGDGNVLGSVYAPTPLVRQTTLGGEAHALYMALQMGVPPLRIWADCQATLDGVLKGQAWATDERKPEAQLWHAIWAIIRDIGVGTEGLTVHKTKAHATAADVQRGATTWWQKRANDQADELAKMGARCHPVDAELDRTWPAYDHRIRLLAMHLARATARMGEAINRDTAARRRSKRPEAKLRERRAADTKRKRDAMNRVWTQALNDEVDEDEQPVMRHRLWEAAVYDQRHATNEGDEKGNVVYCSRCGAYAVDKPRSLVGPCRGRTSRGGLNHLARLKAGKFPKAGSAGRDLLLGPPRPIADAELLRRAPLARIEHHAAMNAPMARQKGPLTHLIM